MGGEPDAPAGQGVGAQGPVASSFLGGAIVLVLGSLGSRLLGIVYRLVLPMLMGGGQRAAVGMGLFQLAYPIFTAIVTLITTGFPLALSKLVAEQLARGDDRAARRVFVAGRAALPVFGLVLTAVLWAVAPVVARFVAGDPRVTLTIRAIAPAIFTVSLASAYRGAFLGMEDMVPHAASQIVEQICRVLTMFGLVLLLLPRGIQWAAAGASFGATVGGLAASVVMIVLWPRRAARLAPHPRRGTRRAGRRPGPRSLLRVLVGILTLALPITVGAMLIPLLNVADAVIVPLRLRAVGLGPEAIALYGVLTGYAAPLVLMPTIFTAALSASLLPAVSSALAAGDRMRGARLAASGLRLAVLLVLPAAVGLVLLAGPLPRLLFHSAAAAAPLRLMAPAVVFLSLQQTSSGVLQGLGRPDLPMWHLAVGGVVKVVLDWVLVANPAWNVGGAAVATTLAFAVASALNLRAVAVRLPAALDWSGMAVRPLLATAVMGAAVWAAQRGPLRHHPALDVGVAVLAGAATYAAALVAVGGVHRGDLEAVPRIGPRLAATLWRYRLLRA